MQRSKKIILIIISLIVASGLGYAYLIWSKPHRDVADEKGLSISAKALFDSFSTNEKSANEKYLNKAIQVTGIVTNIKKNQAGEKVVYLKSSDAVFGVNCTFKNDPGLIGKSDSITFKGICTGFLSDVILNEGILIKK